MMYIYIFSGEVFKTSWSTWAEEWDEVQKAPCQAVKT